jgi:hypothetical protein
MLEADASAAMLAVLAASPTGPAAIDADGPSDARLAGDAVRAVAPASWTSDAEVASDASAAVVAESATAVAGEPDGASEAKDATVAESGTPLGASVALGPSRPTLASATLRKAEPGDSEADGASDCVLAGVAVRVDAGARETSVAVGASPAKDAMAAVSAIAAIRVGEGPSLSVDAGVAVSGCAVAYSMAIVTKSISSVLTVSVDQIETPKPELLTMAGVSVAPHRSVVPPELEIALPVPLTVTADFADPMSVGVVSL